MTNSQTSIPNQTDIQSIARTSLETNIAYLKPGSFVSAGAHQFRSFWTRDFCFTCKGLLAIGKGDVLKSHLSYLIKNRRQDDLVPLYVDSMTPVTRVVMSSFFKAFGLGNISLKLTDDVKPFYLVNNVFEAIDSNLMVLYASWVYLKETDDQEWFDKNQNDFKKIYDFYKTKFVDGLIFQNEHADWQDSAQRKGKMFFTNLLYYHMGIEYKFLTASEQKDLKEQIQTVFFEPTTGLFRSMAGRDNISLEGNLWAIEYGLMMDPKSLYANIKKHPLFTGGPIPGFATYPSYTKDDTYIQVKVTGLQEYHGAMYWSWLIGFSGKVAFLMGDMETFNKIKAKLEKILLRDQVVKEIYNHNEEMTAFKSFLYQSEFPFSWGSGFILDMLNVSKK
jgi:hypothetical protein